MRNWIKRVTITLALVALLAVSAFAADFTHCADALQELGLFNGSEKGFELDRAPTRAEAATMLVRLLGQEETAKALPYTAPFTDVPAWAQGYVQYLYDNGMTSGVTQTTFVPGGACTAQMYATFLMRALGYSDQDGRDFTYAKVLDFAAEKGVANAFNCNEQNFLRDHVVAMSYTALATAPQDGAETNLLQKLMKAGVIDDAKGYDKQFQAYAGYNALLAANADASAKAHMKADVSLNAAMNGVELVTGQMQLDIQMELDMAKLDQSKLAMTGTMDMEMNPLLAQEQSSMTGELAYYFTDGAIYMAMDDQKLKMPLSLEQMLAQMDDISAQAEPLCMLERITFSNNVYTLTYAGDSFGGMMDTAMGQAQEIAGTMEMPEVAITKLVSTVTASGDKITKQAMDMAMEMTVSGQKMAMEMKMDMEYVPGTVNVVLPTDLDTYVDMEEMMAAAIAAA